MHRKIERVHSTPIPVEGMTQARTHDDAAWSKIVAFCLVFTVIYTLCTLLQTQNYPSIRPFPDDSSVVSQTNGPLGAPDVMLHGLVQLFSFTGPTNGGTFPIRITMHTVN